MSSKDQARRTFVDIAFDGVDISKSIDPYLLSVTYTDNEEDEADDIQILIEDRDDVWLSKWLNDAIQAAASSSSSAATTAYKVTAQTGVNIRSGPGANYSKLGALAYGAQIVVTSVSNGWAAFTYSGKTAYVSANYITAVSSAGSSSGSWAIGDAVVANGQPQYTSYGDGTPGATVTNYSGNVTHLNLKSGVPFPIHVGYLGWFAESQVTKAGAAASDPSTKGLHIQAVITRKNWTGNGKSKILDCGQFELDQVDASGPPSTISIKGTALPYNGQIRQTKKSRAWESYTLSGIAKEMAALNGMTCLYESANDPFFKRVEQVTTSDIKFLSTLCHNAGLSLKVTNNIIVLFDQAAYEAKGAVITITRDSGAYLKYKVSSGEADTRYASCRVSYMDPTTGKTIEATAYAADYDAKSKNNQQLEVTAKVTSIAEAQALAVKRLRLHNKFEKTASFTFPGNPDLTSGVTVILSGWGAWDGKYITKQSIHSVGGSGYTTQIRLRPALEGY